MFYIILVLFVLVTGTMVVLMLQNFMTEVPLSLFFWQIPHISTGLLLFLSFLLGALLLYMVSVASAWREGRELKRLREKVKEFERATGKVPSDPLQGAPPVVPMPGMPAPVQLPPSQQG